MIPAHLLNTIITGDARELSAQIPDKSIDLIFTDPVYDRMEDYQWLAETALRVLKPSGACLVFQWTGFLRETFAVMEALKFEWMFSLYIPNRTKDTRCKAGFNKWTPCLWFSKGDSKCPRVADIIHCNAFQAVYGDGTSNHQWSKSPEFISYYVSHFTKTDAVVFDPFSGGGTVPAVCKMLCRQYVGFEIDPETAAVARERVRNTMPSMFAAAPVQMAMEVAL